jgi:hypothetical protein
VVQGLKLSGTGKYSHIRILGDISKFDFGEIFIGRSAEKRFFIENPSIVPANFVIRKAEQETDPYFEFSHLSGTIQPKGKVEITAKYTPVAAGMDSTDYFNITTVSGNTIPIVCIGKGVGEIHLCL